MRNIQELARQLESGEISIAEFANEQGKILNQNLKVHALISRHFNVGLMSEEETKEKILSLIPLTQTLPDFTAFQVVNGELIPLEVIVQ